MDPALYDEAQHRAQLLRQMRASEAIVYASAFAPADVSADPILVAATSTGELHVFLLRPMLVRWRFCAVTHMLHHELM